MWTVFDSILWLVGMCVCGSAVLLVGIWVVAISFILFMEWMERR